MELENLLANPEVLAKRMGNITLEEKGEEEALFIKKKGPLRSRGEAKEAKEWTRGEALPKEEELFRGSSTRKR